VSLTKTQRWYGRHWPPSVGGRRSPSITRPSKSPAASVQNKMRLVFVAHHMDPHRLPISAAASGTRSLRPDDGTKTKTGALCAAVAAHLRRDRTSAGNEMEGRDGDFGGRCSHQCRSPRRPARPPKEWGDITTGGRPNLLFHFTSSDGRHASFLLLLRSLSFPERASFQQSACPGVRPRRQRQLGDGRPPSTNSARWRQGPHSTPF
jgi:hypothetical protein